MTAAASAVAAGLSVAMLILGVGKMATRQAPAHRPPHSRVRRRGPGVVARYRHGRLLAERLRRAGIRLDAGMFVTCVAVCAGIAAVSPILLLGMPLLAPAAAGAVILAAAAVVRSADRRHVDRVAAQLPQVSHQLAAALAAGAEYARLGDDAGLSQTSAVLDELDARQRRLVLLFGGLAVLSAAWLALWLWARGDAHLDWGR